MADEVITTTQEVANFDIDDKIFAEAMQDLEGRRTAAEKPQEEVIEKVDDQSNVEEKAEVEEEKVETPEPPQAEVKAETPAPDTAKPDTKQPYTPEEIRAIAATGDFSKFDSSRLTPGEQAAVKSMQSGLTPKLQRAAEIEKNYQALLQKAQVEAEQRAKEDAEKKYLEEVERYGEEIAATRKETREVRAEITKIQAEREQERRIFQAEQQKVAAQQFHLTFTEKAKDYGIPNNPQYEELVMSRVLAENQTRSLNGEPFISVEDGMRLVSDTVSVKDIDGLDKLLDANPKLREALENRIKEKQSKVKNSGPTVMKSSGGGSGKSEVKPAAAANDRELFDKDPEAFAINYAMALRNNPK